MTRTLEREYDAWLAALQFESVRERFQSLGCDTVLVKPLANDNSKNQIYVGRELSSVASIPSGEVAPFNGSSTKDSAGGPIYQASLDLHWISPTGVHRAPGSKLIYYPQYPEVRISGFLRGCGDAPRSLLVRELRGREPGRLLLLGLASNGRVYSLVLPREAKSHAAVLAHASEPYGALLQWRMDGPESLNPRYDLLIALRRIHDDGWHHGQRLALSGPVPYRARNAAGYTLEALLGIYPNGVAEPDFSGWEIKAHGVGADFAHPRFGPVTLMTPEPDGGLYKSSGVVDFVRKYGYRSINHQNRFDYAGTQRHGDAVHPRCNTRLQVEGFDPISEQLVADGQVALRDAQGNLAASWSFSKLLTHWKSKHAQAAYVPVVSIPDPGGGYLYRYGNEVLLGEGTTFPHLLAAFVRRAVYYDPGSNVVEISPGRWKSHRRNQFRARWRDLSALYEGHELVDVSADVEQGT